jgi:hypothetical protein
MVPATACGDDLATLIPTSSEDDMTLGTILLIVLILLLIGAFPSWPHSRGWGYGPTSGVGLLLIIVIVLLLMGRI